MAAAPLDKARTYLERATPESEADRIALGAAWAAVAHVEALEALAVALEAPPAPPVGVAVHTPPERRPVHDALDRLAAADEAPVVHYVSPESGPLHVPHLSMRDGAKHRPTANPDEVTCETCLDRLTRTDTDAGEADVVDAVIYCGSQYLAMGRKMVDCQLEDGHTAGHIAHTDLGTFVWEDRDQTAEPVPFTDPPAPGDPCPRTSPELVPCMKPAGHAGYHYYGMGT